VLTKITIAYLIPVNHFLIREILVLTEECR